MEIKVATRQCRDQTGVPRQFHYFLTVDEEEASRLLCENYGVRIAEDSGDNAVIPAITTSAARIDELMTLLERRLDNVVFRLGLAATRREARQLVNHGHFTVNGKRVNIPSYLVKPGEVIAVRDKSRSSAKFKKMVEDDRFVAAPKWLEKAKNAPLEGKVVAMPARDDIDFEVAVNLIVELYSK